MADAKSVRDQRLRFACAAVTDTGFVPGGSKAGGVPMLETIQVKPERLWAILFDIIRIRTMLALLRGSGNALRWAN